MGLGFVLVVVSFETSHRFWHGQTLMRQTLGKDCEIGITKVGAVRQGGKEDCQQHRSKQTKSTQIKKDVRVLASELQGGPDEKMAEDSVNQHTAPL